MNIKLTSITVAMALGASTAVLGGLLSKEEIKRNENQISATFKAQKLACDRYSGNAKNILVGPESQPFQGDKSLFLLAS